VQVHIQRRNINSNKPSTLSGAQSNAHTQAAQRNAQVQRVHDGAMYNTKQSDAQGQVHKNATRSTSSKLKANYNMVHAHP